MKLFFLITVAALSISSTGFAQTSAAEHAAHHGRSGVESPASAIPNSEGEVRKVDIAQGKVTLKHGPIANLDMPGMTMVFKVAAPKMLDNLKPGEKVKFAASSMDGALTVTAIEKAK